MVNGPGPSAVWLREVFFLVVLPTKIESWSLAKMLKDVKQKITDAM